MMKRKVCGFCSCRLRLQIRSRSTELPLEEVRLQNINMSELYNEYLLLEARLALISSAGYPDGPPVGTQAVYTDMIPRKLYDTAFVLQRWATANDAVIKWQPMRTI